MSHRLSDLQVNDRGIVTGLEGDSSIKKRLLEMGFVKNTEVLVKKVAPLGDPMELVLKGYHLSLRRDEAKGILIEKI